MLVSVHLTCEHASYGHRPSNSLNYHVNYHITTCTITPFAFNWTGLRMVMLPVSHNSCTFAEDFAAAVSSFVPAERISRWWLPTASLFHVWCEPLVALNVLSLARCRQFAQFSSAFSSRRIFSLRRVGKQPTKIWSASASSISAKSHFSAKARNLDAN